MNLSSVALLAFLTTASGQTIRTGDTKFVSSFEEKQFILPEEEPVEGSSCECRTDYDCQRKVCNFNGYTGTCGLPGSTFDQNKLILEEPVKGGGGDSCSCRTDYDCRKMVCIPSTYNGGTCGIEGTGGGPAPTPAPVEPTDCCPEPKSIPTMCEVEMLIDLLDIAVSSDHKLAPQWLRLSFHDAGTFDVALDEGGANGCLMTTSNFRQQPENGFLDLPINTLQTIKNTWESHADTCIQVSAADIIQFAGRFSAIRQAGSSTTAGILTQQKKDDLLQFQWGRSDETNCDVSTVDNLPGFSLGSPGGNIPVRCLNAGKEIKEKMMERNGFTALEAVALVGAHTIGKTRNTFGSALSNPWVPNGADNATPNGPVFDNDFHQYLSNIPAATVAAFASNQSPFDVLLPDWFMDNASGGLNHLDTDVVLAFPSQNLGTHPHFHTFTDMFAAQPATFLTEFFKALDKMSKLGVEDPLFEPTDCTPCDVNAEIEVGTVVQLVSTLGEATSDADESLKEFQATDEFIEKLEFQTTEVTKEDTLSPKEADAELQQEIQQIQITDTKVQVSTSREKLSSGNFLN